MWRRNDQNPEELCILGYNALNNGKYKEAIKYFDEVLSLTRKNNAEAWRGKGVFFLNLVSTKKQLNVLMRY